MARPFVGKTPTASNHLITKAYADALGGVDSRKLAKWYAKLATGSAKCVFWGDSTTGQLYSQGFIPANGTSTTMINDFPDLSAVTFRNHGMTGALLKDASGTGSAGSANTAGNYCNVDDVIATSPDMIIACWLINDFRGQITPGAAGNPLGGNFPDYRAAKYSAAQANMALVGQYYMKASIDRIRATLPDCVIVWVCPNALTSDCSYMTNSVTPQQCMDLLALTYRGSSNGGGGSLTTPTVPFIEDYASGVLVVDRSTLYGDSPYQSVNELITNPSDGLHPTVTAYRERLYILGKLMAGTPTSGITSTFHATQLAAAEKALGGGWYRGTVDLNVLLYSGEYEQLYTCAVSTNSGSFFDLGLGPEDNDAAHAWGVDLIGDPLGNVRAPGLALGDVIVWNISGVQTIRVVTNMPDGYPASYLRWYSGFDINGKALPSDISAGTLGKIYRHKFANSLVARKNLDRAVGTPSQAFKAYTAVYPFVITSASNGAFTCRGINTRNPLRKRTASDHKWLASDIIGLPGVEGTYSAANSFNTYYGRPLAGATITQSGLDVTVTLSGVDFSKAAGLQGVLLTNDDAGNITSDEANALLAIKYKNVQRLLPANSTTAPTALGIVLTTQTTISHPTQATTNYKTNLRRTNFAGSATAGNGTGFREAVATKLRGSAAPIGGFSCRLVFGLSSNVTGYAGFFGLNAALTALAGSASALVNMVGLGFDTGDASTGNWYLMTNDASGTADRNAISGAGGVNGLAALVRDTTSALELIITARPNSSVIYVTLRNLSTGVTHLLNQPYTANLPVNTTYLGLIMQHYNGAVASAAGFDFIDADIGYNE